MTYREPLSVLMLFRSGMDTADIANHLKISEASALERLTKERSASLGKPNPFDPPKEPARHKLLPFAGSEMSRISGV